MREVIDSYGGDGEYEVRFRTGDGTHAVWVRRDVWVDRGGEERWVVWAQERSWGNHLPDEDEAALGSIVVTHPVAIAFLEQLGELLVDPRKFRHEPEFADTPLVAPSEEPLSPT
jgi:hypothetical protein